MLNTLRLEDIKPESINLTGVRLLVLFSLLLESPKTADEINEYFERNNYPKDTFSTDTLRNDLNALRYAGCNITRADKSNNFKYTLTTHPFELFIDKDIAMSLYKLYNKSYKYLTVEQLIKIENLFCTLADYTSDDDTSEFLKGISLIKNIDKNILRELIPAVKRKSTVTFMYKAPNLGKVEYEFSLDKFNFRSKKLYIDGYNKTYKTPAFLLISRIISSVTEHLTKDIVEKPVIRTVYELKNSAMLMFNENEYEKILEKHNNKLVIEYKSDSEFKIVQKVLSYGPNCTVIEPENIRQKVITELKRMYEVYND